MAICLSGDLDQDKTIQLIDKYFGSVPSKEVPAKVLPKEEPITEVKTVEVLGPQAEFLYLGYRFDGVSSIDNKYVTLIDMMLSNSQAGLIDLDLVQQQKVLRAGSYTNFLKDYGAHIFVAYPRQGQTLEEAKDLILGEIEKIKNGEFEDWLPLACVNNLKLREIQAQESNDRAHTFAQTFAEGTSWQNYLNFNDELAKITKPKLLILPNSTIPIIMWCIQTP
jgi:predicted Zn-dependent peptidase